jgi:hypothetical protein
MRHLLGNTPLALSAMVTGSTPPVTVIVAGHTAETHVDRIVRELLASTQSPHHGIAAKFLSAIKAFVARVTGKKRHIDRGIYFWYTLPENSLTGEAQLRQLFIEPSNVSWGPLIRITDRPDIEAVLVRLIAAWRD